MPCDTITTQALSEKLKNAVPEVVKAAMTAEGLRVTLDEKGKISASDYRQTWTWERGVGIAVQVRGVDAQQSQQKFVQAYSKAAVSWAAQRAGWNVAKTGPQTLTLTRR